MRFLSLCSGIEAASVAWEPLGWKAAGFAEIDPFACALLRHYWPDVPNLGDLSLITDDHIRSLGPIDVVVGGTPCQDVSVAGERRGIDGERSRLFFDFVRVFNAARSISGARFALWENVPGALYCNGGRDFGLVVSALAGLDGLVVPVGGWEFEGMALGALGLVEWSVLDAQWFGVAQRRERLFALVDAGDWQSRGPILLESESLRGDSPPSRPARTSSSRSLAADPGVDSDVADPLVVKEHATYTHEGANNFRLRNVVACFDETQLTHPENRSACGPDTAALARSARPPTVALDDGQLPRARRLTPRECERLTGLVDDFTAIEFGGRKPARDSLRYAALGNSIPTPLLRWIGRRLDECA